MDRISALRNVEDALASFEDGDCDLATLERQVQAVLRTYVSEFDVGESLAVYRVAPADGAADGNEESGAGTGDLVLVAAGPNEAREQARELADDLPTSLTVERVSD